MLLPCPLIYNGVYYTHNTVEVTINKAGRIVVPKQIRERYNMHPGTAIEIENKPEGVILKVSGEGISLIRKQGILVHHSGDKTDLDMADFIKKERKRRSIDIAAASPPQ